MLTRFDKSCHTPVVARTPSQRLRELLDASPHTQKTLATTLGVGYSTLSTWLAGTYTPRDLDVRARLEHELGEDPWATYIVTDDGRPAVRIEDVADEVFIDEFLRRWRARPPQSAIHISSSVKDRVRERRDDGPSSAHA